MPILRPDSSVCHYQTAILHQERPPFLPKKEKRPKALYEMLFFRVDFLFLAVFQTLDVLPMHKDREHADDEGAGGRDEHIPQAWLRQQMIEHKGEQEGIGCIEDRADDAGEGNDPADDEDNQKRRQNQQKHAPVGAEHQRRRRDDALAALKTEIERERVTEDAEHTGVVLDTGKIAAAKPLVA